MLAPLDFVRDVEGENSYGVKIAPSIYSIKLTKNVASSFTIPSTYTSWLAVISGITLAPSIWVARNAVAAAPTLGTFSKSTCELNPSVRRVYAGDVLSFFNDGVVSNSGYDVGLSLYPII